MTRTTKMDRTIANIFIKKGYYETEISHPVIQYTSWVISENESTEVVFVGEINSEINTVEFRNAIAETIADFRTRGIIVNPYGSEYQ